MQVQSGCDNYEEILADASKATQLAEQIFLEGNDVLQRIEIMNTQVEVLATMSKHSDAAKIIAEIV